MEDKKKLELSDQQLDQAAGGQWIRDFDVFDQGGTSGQTSVYGIGSFYNVDEIQSEK